MSTQTNETGGMLAVIDMAIAEYKAQAQDQRDQTGIDGVADATSIETAEGFEADCAKLVVARAAVAKAIVALRVADLVLNKRGIRFVGLDQNPHGIRDVIHNALASVEGAL